MIDYASLAEPVARRLLGEPNAELSSKDELRFGSKGSISVDLKKGVWYDFETEENGGLLDLIKREVPEEEPMEWLKREGYTAPAQNNQTDATPDQTGGETGGQTTRIFDYTDEERRILYQVVRIDEPGKSKDIKQRRPDGRGGFVWKLGDVRRVLYRLPELLAAPETAPLYVAEGEPKVDLLMSWGLRATCCSGGANKWRDEYDSIFAADGGVIVLQDNDAAGHKHAQDVARRAAAKGARVRVVLLPDLPPKGDVVDWAKKGGTKEELLRLADAAPDWVPTQKTKGKVIGELDIVCVADVPAEKVEWLWKPRIARGKLTMFAGLPDVNKSTLALDLAARISNAGPLPAGEGRAPLGNVIILTAEDDIADTVRPRLEAAGADLKRISVITAVQDDDRKRGFDLTVDIDRLRVAINEIGEVALVIIDPVSAYMGRPGKLDTHRITDVRGTLSPLAKMAADCNTAVVGIDHLNKSGGTQALMRIMGSIAFAAAPRSVYIVVRDEEDDDRRLFLPAKNNLAKIRTGLAFRVVEKLAPAPVFDCYPAIEWENEPVIMTADEALAKTPDGRKSEPAELAKKLLTEMLANGPVPQKEVEKRAKAVGIGSKSLRTAGKALGVKPGKEGGRVGGRWTWRLPGKDEFPF